MLITDKELLKQYTTIHRLWQGIPSIEITKNMRMFSTFFSGTIMEGIGNYAVLLKSDDKGETFSEPIAVAYKKEGRCFDSSIWIDPLGRLWFTWAYASVVEESAVYGVICDNPDAEELIWSEVFKLGKYVMLNKPTVLTTGEWLFPITAWDPKIKMPAFPPEDYGHKKEETGAFAYKSIDQNTKFKKMGGVCAPQRAFDEHIIVELKDGRLMMLIRTNYGIAKAYSYDRGNTWTEAVDSKIKGPCARFCVRRLRSGRLLLVNHHNFTGRNNLTAFLSDDDGQTWSSSLLLDERSYVAYPDAVEAVDGYIYITYDHERGCLKESLESVKKAAREILYCKITEQDILAGKLVSPHSKMKCVISKLGDYVGNDNPYKEINRYTDAELAELICQGENVNNIFDYYPIACENMGQLDTKKLDALFSKFNAESKNKFAVSLEIVRLVRSISASEKERMPIIEMVKNVLCENICEKLSISQIAEKICISEYYLMHIFKKQTGLTIVEYKNSLKMMKAKVLLKNGKMNISSISEQCGFESIEYFSKSFKKSEGVSPSKYRKLKFLKD